jgi:rhodanese-related sulfurtransferase
MWDDGSIGATKKPVQRSPETGFGARLFSGTCFPGPKSGPVGARKLTANRRQTAILPRKLHVVNRLRAIIAAPSTSPAPWNTSDWEVNPHFIGQIKKLAGTNHTKRPIVLICRSGNRSQEAGEALERAGFTRVYNVTHGFEGELNEKHQRNSLAGWRRDGLPWEQC